VHVGAALCMPLFSGHVLVCCRQQCRSVAGSLVLKRAKRRHCSMVLGSALSEEREWAAALLCIAGAPSVPVHEAIAGRALCCLPVFWLCGLAQPQAGCDILGESCFVSALCTTAAPVGLVC
jgi:hypothetical protein